MRLRRQYARWPFYELGRCATMHPACCLTGVRHFNVPDIGKVGGVLLASNHQSYLDPVLVGIALDVPVHYMARRSLFRVPGFAQAIRVMCAHPLNREGVDSDALRTATDILKRGEPLLMFPEGTRTRDGSIGRMKKGVARIALRCGVPIMPVCVEGAFECWPRTSLLPRPARVAVAYGEPVQARGDDERELMDEVAARIAEMQQFLRGYLGRV